MVVVSALPSRRRSPENPRTSGRAAAARRERAIYAVVRLVPRGRVVTYGEIATLAGLPSGHRIVARAMRVCPESLPWHRVIGKKDARRGQIAVGDAEHADFQRARLEAEGVEFDRDGFIPLRRFGMLAR
jgi:methylated-DNA-protein-cysteine methyltransferase-like protein